MHFTFIPYFINYAMEKVVLAFSYNEAIWGRVIVNDLLKVTEGMIYPKRSQK